MNEHELDTLFDAARAAPPEVPLALADRVLADARAAQADPFKWRSWLSQLGGGPGIGGLIAASCVGFWIGVAPPQGLPDLAALVMGQESTSDAEESTSLFGWDIEEG